MCDGLNIKKYILADVVLYFIKILSGSRNILHMHEWNGCKQEPIVPFSCNSATCQQVVNDKLVTT